MEILDVVRSTPAIVQVNSQFAVSFRIVGAEIPFQFPFQNASLSENKIIFVKQKEGERNA